MGKSGSHRSRFCGQAHFLWLIAFSCGIEARYSLLVMIYFYRFSHKKPLWKAERNAFPIGASAYFFTSEPFGVTSRTA